MLELNFYGQSHPDAERNAACQRYHRHFWRVRGGKTSLINAISGLTRPQSGRIVLNNRVLNDAEKKVCLSPDKRRIGYVFQDARLFPHYSVRGNLRYGMAKAWPDSSISWWRCWASNRCWIVCRRRCRVVKTARGDWPRPVNRAGTAAAG